MTTSLPSPSPSNRPYISDSTSAAEMSRLLYQDRLLRAEVGGLISEQEPANLVSLNRVLDIACGPGGWVLDMAFEHPLAQVVGIDSSEPMIRYARTQADELGRGNADFLVMDATRPLDFPDNSFDMVNGRFLSTFMPVDIWPGFLRECLRIVRPGGIVRLTDLEFGMSNSPGHELMCSISIRAMMRGGLSFSTDGRHLCMLTMLGQLLEEAGVRDIRRKPYLVDYSMGSGSHDAWYRNLQQVWTLGRPFAIGLQVVTAEEFDQAYHQCLREMQLEKFAAVWFVATFWGTRPVAEHK